LLTIGDQFGPSQRRPHVAHRPVAIPAPRSAAPVLVCCRFFDRSSASGLPVVTRTHPATMAVIRKQSYQFVYQDNRIDTQNTHTQTLFNGPLSRTTRVSLYQKGKPIWILLKQEIVSGSGISWAICKSAPRFKQITMPAPHHSVFNRPDALPVAQPTALKH